MVRSLELTGLDWQGCTKLYRGHTTTASAISDNSGMPSLSASTSVVCTGGPLSAVDTDLLIVPWFQDEPVSAVAGVDAATGGEIGRAIDSKEFQGKAYDLFFTPITDSAWRARRIALIGGGSGDRSSDLIRKLAITAGLAARSRHIGRAAFTVRGNGSPAEVSQAVAEGLTLAEFYGGTYKTGEPPPPPPPVWTVVAPDATDTACTEAVARGRILGECSNLARDLANEPGNTLTPREFAKRAAALAAEAGVRTEILDESQIEKLGMGLLLGVARGSAEPPRLIVFRWEPAGAPASPVLGLVGKGITFDTGGISIKPADRMELMKDDMSGGAAVACAMRAIATLKAPMRVIGVVPATENMPGGRAIKPGDILKSAAGKTVEVINTDAEGRLILGDGLWYARQLGATHLVDVATLTGAVVVALGKVTTGLFGNNDAWIETVRRVANRAGDRAWPMPLFEEYREQIKSDIADIMNTGGRAAGSITAAMFLKEFAGGVPWAHLDIAGTAWAEEAKPYLPKGPSGVAVRTLAGLAFEKF
ncbi:MAG TPA: leucyl aminopeptidase [Vicinamibacterales bacterium]|nr:leucyl aminopeptidase [Vicinamibacterales bacterium]